LSSTNALLASLSKVDAEQLRPHLKTINLHEKQVLFDAGDLIAAVYFPTGAVISLVVGLSTGEMVEAAMVGKDGMVGGSSALDGKVSLTRAIVQLDGPALVCDPDKLKRAALQSETLLSTIIRNEQTLFAQAQQSTACMAAHDVLSRLCRWLLRARDLADSDTLHFTQEFLAEMLGVRRTSVTAVAHTLQQAGLIKYSRGSIQLLNLTALNDAACECYEATKAHYEALIGPSASGQHEDRR
jgi:CRP-like cAMP-binding protein